MKRLLSIFAICLFHLGLFAQDGQEMVTYTSGYYVQGGETHIAGDTKNIGGYVFDESGSPVEGIVATLTFGVAGDSDFNEANWNYSVEGFEAYTSGNGVNGRSDGGTVYIIRPNCNGYIDVGVVHNAGKKLYILEDEVAMEGYNGLTADEQYRGLYGFPVKAGSTYKIYATGSKLGFYGFKFLYTPDSSATFEAYNLTVSTNIKNNVYCNPRGTTVQTAGSTIWLDTYSYGTYRFKHWTANGEVVSTDQYFSYTMPQKDVNMVAVYEFNPSNPGDPASAENTYKLTLESKPANAGYFNLPKVSKVEAGSTTWLYAYTNKNGYVFKEWQVDDKKISSLRELDFVMPEKHITLTAVFEFKPTSPGNPGTNLLVDGELMLDDFMPGEAWSAAYNATDGNFDQVYSAIMIGEIGEWDASTIVGNCQNLTSLDVSRTTGMNYVRGFAFNDNSQLNTVSLPASIASIGDYAFMGCPSLTTINLHAVTPPTISSWAFTDGSQSIVNQVTVFVPAASLSLYENAEVWKDLISQGLQIRPLGTDVCDLEINLPEGTDASLYKDMYLEAVNTKSGQCLRYVMTNSITYTFNSIIKNTTWNIYLKNAKGEVLGTIENVEVKNQDVTVTFESLETPQNVTLTVLAGDTDVTAKTTIAWSDAAGNFLAQGATIKNLLKGNVVQYNVTLSEALAMEYQLPEGGVYTVEDGDNAIQVTLTALPKLAITGTVIDYNKSTEDNLVALPGAIVAVSQTINGKFSKTYTAKTDAEGKWSLKEEVYVAPTEITASKTGYISETQTFDTLNVTVIDTFALRDINGTTINLTLTYQTLNGEQKDYDDVANVAYTVVNAATGEALTGLSFQESKIVMQNKLEQGTQLILTATSKNQKFMPVTVNAIVDSHDKADVTFFIKQLGGIQATFGQTENSGACVGILYDANGQFVKRYEYNGNKLVIDELKDGSYTLVTMANSQLFNTVGQLSQFGEMGLRNGVDFVRNNVTVKSGEWTVVNITKVPYLDETKLYYTGVNTSFSANKSQITAGQYLTLRGQVDFKDAYAGQVSNVELVVNLTDDCEFVDNSVMLGKNLTSYTLNGKQLIVPIGMSKEQVRFCVIPTKEGTYEPSASVSFAIGSKKVLQPIGSAQTTVKGVTINVPATIAKPQFTASGTAIAKSDVYVYVDDMLMGKTMVKANGKWSMQCELVADATDKAEHPVYARVVTPEKAELLTDTKIVTLDENAILPQEVNMSFYNGWLGKTVKVDWDMIEKKVNPASYMFYTTTDFTFTISFTVNNSEKVTGVQLIVYKNNNSYDILNAQFNEKKQIWVVSQRYSSWALPTAVKVKYLIDGQQQTLSEDKDDEGIEHSNPILDPSGYVYEAVSSNRLQGVTASIYYKEEKKDMYGESYWVENLWNAEDYAQVNPQFTDENGMYQWDVPNGLWQVRLEKEGYLQTKSEWLPVPPPQLDINLPMTRTSKPEVTAVKASSEGVEITFNMYMDPATLIPYNFNVTQSGNPVAGELLLLDEEEAYKGAAQTYASKVYFKFAEELPSGDGLQLIVNKAVKSYAGISMQADNSQDFAVELVVNKITVDSDIDLVNVTYGETRTVTVGALPNEAAKGQTVSVQSLSELVATVDAETLTLDENGQADLVISGELPGSTKLVFNVVGTDVRDTLTVNVKEAEKLVTIAPRASRVSGSKLYNGEKIQLSCETEDAVIKYTLDGSDPAEAGESVRTYKADEPIVITTDNVTLKAIAEGKDLKPSEVAEFNYELKKSTIGYALKGWTWVSHNMENAVSTADFTDGIAANVERIVGKTSEVINDPNYGLIGSLTELQPAVGYKIKVKANTDKIIKGNELNANENTVSVKAGWNWIGYPLNQTMTVNEALEYFEASVGDEIVGNDGTAVYDGETWNGLELMNPGQGYLFKTATTADIQFNTNTVSVAASRVGKRNWLIGSPWSNDKYAYPNIMPLFAEFYVDGVKYDDGEFVVAAFAGDECRGVGRWIKGRLMMNVCGDGGEEITFKAYNKASEQYFTVAENVTFVSDNCGSWFAPMKLTLGNETTGMSEVNKDLFISVGNGYITVNAGGKNINSLTLTNMGGVMVLSASNLGTGATITTGSLSDGMYIVTIKAEGKTYYEKILKGNK